MGAFFTMWCGGFLPYGSGRGLFCPPIPSPTPLTKLYVAAHAWRRWWLEGALFWRVGKVVVILLMTLRSDGIHDTESYEHYCDTLSVKYPTCVSIDLRYT